MRQIKICPLKSTFRNVTLLQNKSHQDVINTDTASATLLPRKKTSHEAHFPDAQTNRNILLANSTKQFYGSGDSSETSGLHFSDH